MTIAISGASAIHNVDMSRFCYRLLEDAPETAEYHKDFFGYSLYNSALSIHRQLLITENPTLHLTFGQLSPRISIGGRHPKNSPIPDSLECYHLSIFPTDSYVGWSSNRIPKSYFSIGTWLLKRAAEKYHIAQWDAYFLEQGRLTGHFK